MQSHHVISPILYSLWFIIYCIFRERGTAAYFCIALSTSELLMPFDALSTSSSHDATRKRQSKRRTSKGGKVASCEHRIIFPSPISFFSPIDGEGSIERAEGGHSSSSAFNNSRVVRTRIGANWLCCTNTRNAMWEKLVADNEMETLESTWPADKRMTLNECEVSPNPIDYSIESLTCCDDKWRKEILCPVSPLRKGWKKFNSQLRNTSKQTQQSDISTRRSNYTVQTHFQGDSLSKVNTIPRDLTIFS